MSQLLYVEIPNFGSTVLGSLNEQRLLGQHCDVAIMVNGQAFKAHRAVLAASSLYFRDLFSGSTETLFELPSSVAPSCFQQILSFCYTGKLTMAASEQLMVMYTAGYLQIQNIVERGMDLMFKANSPHCDSQSAATEELTFDPQSPNASPTLLPGDRHVAPCKIKQERLESPLTLQGADPAGDARGPGRPGGRVARSRTLFYTGAGRNGMLPGVQYYPLASGERSSPGASSLPTTDSPTSHRNEEEEFDEDLYDSVPSEAHGHGYGRSAALFTMQEKLELSSLPLSFDRRPCVLIGRDTVALPASLISQIGYRCHPTLYTEGDPGEKLELVAGSAVFMTRGQLMNCHLCAGIKHKVLLRRLLATFFDRNTLANSCGTGIRSSTSDPSRKPLDNRVLNTVKLYCQNFAPNFKESEMNVIAADMCTNARRVRKRWLPKIQSMLPERVEVHRGADPEHARATASQKSMALPFDMDFRLLPHSSLILEQPLYAERQETGRSHLEFVRAWPEDDTPPEGAEPEADGPQAGRGAEALLESSPDISPAGKGESGGGSSPTHTGEQEEELGEEQLVEEQ